MSRRLSRKADLSPSITRGSNGIDLGKNSGVDMGRKSEPSVTSGGIGITQEVTKIGGVGVSLGVGVDITPIDFGVSANPAEGTISIATGAEIPGGLLGVAGGVTIDTNTGQIIGGSIGGEIGGLGINLSNSEKGGLGIEFTLQIPGTPIEFSLGLGFPPGEEPKTPTPTPTPTPGGFDPSIPPPKLPKPIYPIPTPGNICTVYFGFSFFYWNWLSFYETVKVGNQVYQDYGNYNNGILMGGRTGQRTVNYYNNPGAQNSRISLDEPIRQLYSNHYYFTGSPYYVDVAFYVDEERKSSLIISVRGAEENIYRYIESLNKNEEYNLYNNTERIIHQEYYFIISSNCSNSPPPPPPPDPPQYAPPLRFPNPPPRRQKKVDSCCRETLIFLRAIYTRLGLAKFPGKLPSTIIQEVQKEGEAPPEPPSVPIPDLTSLLMWQFEHDDERWGQWQVEINIKDSDITKEGDQGKSIKLPNLAESIAEFEGQLLSIMTNVDALVALQVKTLAESGMARQESIKAYLASKAIIKYMAFKSTETDVPVPMTFTAGAETISELLKESEGHIKGTDYVEKETLRDVYLDLLQAAAIIRAVHWQKIDSKTDTKSQLLNILKGSVNLAVSIAKPQNPNGDNGEKTFDPDKDFEDFIDSVEDGFRNTTGITDIQNPYGKPPNQRPRIRQIGDNISQAGGGN